MSAWQNKYALLLRREFWEHRALWLAPAAVGLLLVLTPLFGNFRMAPGGGARAGMEMLSPETYRMFGQALMFMVTTGMGITACVVCAIYLLDSLYAERKDRSILFWKSLPVSDAQTVLAKLAVVVLVVPLLTLVMALLAQFLLSGTLYLRYEVLRPAIGLHSMGAAIATLPRLAGVWLYAILWYAPLIGYLALASVLAKRAPLMYAILPPTVLVILEGLLFQSNKVVRYVGEWVATPWISVNWNGMVSRSRDGGGGGGVHWGNLYAEPKLWVGLAIAAAMVYIIIRLRRYRDDT